MFHVEQNPSEEIPNEGSLERLPYLHETGSSHRTIVPRGTVRCLVRRPRLNVPRGTVSREIRIGERRWHPNPEVPLQHLPDRTWIRDFVVPQGGGVAKNSARGLAHAIPKSEPSISPVDLGTQSTRPHLLPQHAPSAPSSRKPGTRRGLVHKRNRAAQFLPLAPRSVAPVLGRLGAPALE